VCGTCTELLICDSSRILKNVGCPRGTFCVNGSCSSTDRNVCRNVEGKCTYKQEAAEAKKFCPKRYERICLTDSDCKPIARDCGQGKCIIPKDIPVENTLCKMVGEHVCGSCRDLLIYDVSGVYKNLGCPVGSYCLARPRLAITAMYHSRCEWNEKSRYKNRSCQSMFRRCMQQKGWLSLSSTNPTENHADIVPLVDQIFVGMENAEELITKKENHAVLWSILVKT